MWHLIDFIAGIVVLSIISIVCGGTSRAQDVSHDFIESLIYETTSHAALMAACDSTELRIASRFGIEYSGAAAKWMIGNDIDPEVAAKYRGNSSAYFLDDVIIDSTLVLSTFTTRDKSYSKKFYFRNGKFISPLLALTSGWYVYESRYFRILVSDSSRFFRCTADSLDSYVDRMRSVLQFSEQDMRTLAREKILYALCTDLEIQAIAGVPTKGLFLLAEDAVVSTYRYHIHELTHFLVNFKLRHLPLYTNPMLQEGLAVALGGRGGLSADVLQSMGAFLVKSGAMTPVGLLKPSEFRSSDASMTYPVAGLFNKFALQMWGIQKYLKFLKAHSSDDPTDTALDIDSTVFRTLKGWKAFADKVLKNPLITLDPQRRPSGKKVYESDSAEIFNSRGSLTFRLQSGLRLGSMPTLDNSRYVSTGEEVQGYRYLGEKYLVTASENEVRVYDRALGMLIANYVPGFVLPAGEIKAREGWFGFELARLRVGFNF